MTIGATLATAASAYPEKPAFIMENRAVSYAVADALANCFSNALLSHGTDSGDRIAIIGHNSIEYAVAYFGIARAGGVSLHLSPRMTLEEITHCVETAGVKIAVCDPSVGQINVDVRISMEPAAFDSLYANFSDVDPRREQLIDSPSSATYTGGTTGYPKGGLHTARSRLTWATIAHDFFGLTPNDVMANAAPMGHAAGGFIWFQPGVCAAATQVLMPHWDVPKFIDLVERCCVSATFLVPAQIGMLLDHGAFNAERLRHLRKIVYGGAPTPLGLIERADCALPECEFIQNYGMTEIGPLVTLYEQDRVLYPEALGRPTEHTECAIFTEPGKHAKPGEIGELCFRGATLMTGFIGDPAQTEEFFRTGDGWGWTGDLAVMNEDKVISLVGRTKDMIISGGLNVYPAEIERVLMDVPVVLECAVFGIPDDILGELPAAVIIAQHATTAEEILTACEMKMARHKRPRRIEFVEKIPKSPAGKVLRTALREQFG